MIVHGVGAEGLHGARTPLDMGNAGTAMRLSMGLLAGAALSSTLIGDASLMRRPMERVAGPLRAMGAQIDDPRGPPAGAHPRRPRLCRHRLRDADGQCAGEVGDPAGGAVRRGPHHASPSLRRRAITPSACSARFGVRVERDGATRRAWSAASALTGHAIEVPADFSSAAFFLVAGALAAHEGLTLRNVGINPTRTGLLEMLRLMGAGSTVHRHAATERSPSRSRISQCMPAPLHGIEVPESLVPLSIDEFPVFFIAAACADGRDGGAPAPRNCGSRRATGWPSWRRAWRRWGSSTRCCPTGGHFP